MKLYRNAIILVVVLALLIGAYVIISKKKGSDTTNEATTTQNLTILSIDSAKVSEVTVKNKDILLDFTKNGTDWVLKSPVGLKTNKDQISTLISGITGITPDKLIEEKASNLNQYGLDNPVLEIVILSTENKAQTLEFGNKTPTQDGYYLMDMASNKVVTVSTNTVEQFLDAKNAIRDKTLFNLTVDATAGTVKDATGISMYRAGELLFTAKLEADSNWALTAPFVATANVESMIPIITAIAQLSVSGFVEDNATDLDKYGLKNPAYALEVDTTSKGKNKILLGSVKQGSTELYAVFEGSKDVFTIDPSTLTFLDKPFKEIIEPFIYIAHIDTVTRIDVTMDGRTDTSTILTDKDNGEVKADNDKDKFTINGKDATAKDANDDQPFRKYYQALIGITLDGIEIDAVPTGKPEITINYTLTKAPGTMKVEFIPKDKDYYYVVKNGKYSNIVVQKSQFDKPDEGVRATYKTLIDLSLIHISEPTRRTPISYAVFCLKK